MPQENDTSGNEPEHEHTPRVPLNGEGAEDTTGPFDEILSDAPPEVRRQVAMMMSVAGGPLQNPFLSKLDAEHIHKMMDHSEAESVREDRQAYSNRKWAFAALATLLVAVLAILFFLVWQEETSLLGQILAGSAIFAGGFGGGFGVGRRGR